MYKESLNENSRPLTARLLPLAALGLAVLAVASPLRAQIDYATPYAFTLFAGAGSVGSADGTGTAAHFDEPYGLALDSGGDLYVADRNNDIIRKISSAGSVTTIAGLAGNGGSTDGTGSAARFDVPTGVAVDSSGNVYVADAGNNVIRKITSSGVVTTIAGLAGTAGSVDGTGAAANFSQPFGVAVDSAGNIYVSDFGNNSIRKITPGAVVTTLAGTEGVTSTNYVDGLPSNPGSADGTGGDASFSQPAGITIDSSGNLYVADSANNTIRKITSAGVVTTLAGLAGTTGSTDGTGSAARFNAPRGVTVDSSGNVYVADGGNTLIRKVTSAGVVTTLAGTPGTFEAAPGTGAAAYFDVPVGIAVDGSGNLYVSEELGQVIAKGAVAPVVTPPPPTVVAPVFTTQPISVSVTGGTVALDAAASSAKSYQWMLNGSPVSGATDSTLLLASAASATGTYTCVATNSAGSATSSPATVTVNPSSNPGRLINLSARAQVGTGGNIIFGGFAVGPFGTAGSQPLLIRASGPAIAAAPFDVPGTLPDPQLQLFSSSDTVLDTNTGWGGSASIAATASAVGAFSWNAPASHDAALSLSLASGTYTAQVSGESGDTGDALLEIYDATPAGTYNTSLPRLINLSARVAVGTGSNVLLAGFVIGGDTALTVLIRASGPAIAAAPFNVPGTLPDPQLTLQNPSTGAVYAQNTSWGGDSEIAATAASVGAFSWTVPTSHDSALLITLPPGSYTAGVAGTSGDTGVAIVEVYEVK
jgi:sugar lactone lactonase YvrE